MPCDQTHILPLASGVALLGCCDQPTLCCPRYPTDEVRYVGCVFNWWTAHIVGREQHGVMSCTGWNAYYDNCYSHDRTFWLNWHSGGGPWPEFWGTINHWTGEATQTPSEPDLGVRDYSIMAANMGQIDAGFVSNPTPLTMVEECRVLYDAIDTSLTPPTLSNYLQWTCADFRADGSVNANLHLCALPNQATLGPGYDFSEPGQIGLPTPDGYHPICDPLIGSGSVPPYVAFSVRAAKGWYKCYGSYALTKWSIKEVVGEPQPGRCHAWEISLLECRLGVGTNDEFVEIEPEEFHPTIGNVQTICDLLPRSEANCWIAQKDVGCPNMGP